MIAFPCLLSMKWYCARLQDNWKQIYSAITEIVWKWKFFGAKLLRRFGSNQKYSPNALQWVLSMTFLCWPCSDINIYPHFLRPVHPKKPCVSCYSVRCCCFREWGPTAFMKFKVWKSTVDWCHWKSTLKLSRWTLCVQTLSARAWTMQRGAGQK